MAHLVRSLLRALDVLLRYNSIPMMSPVTRDPTKAKWGLCSTRSSRPEEAVNAEVDKEEAALGFFHPTFIRSFCPALFDCAGATKTQTNGENKTPTNAAAFMAALQKLDKAEPLACDAYYDLRPLLSPEEKVEIFRARDKRHLAFDLVQTVAAVEVAKRPLIMAVYVARGRPDKWQPWTKADHRRIVTTGVWVCPNPKNASNEQFWEARRTVGLVENIIEEDAGACGSPLRTAEASVYWYNNIDTEQCDGEEEGSARTGDSERSVQAKRKARLAEDSYTEHPSQLHVMNTHLGKAGGLNFGLEALMRTAGIVHPTPQSPMMFGIIDARHACDARFWLHVLPCFYMLRGDSDENVSFDPEICLCQLPHSYIGMEYGTDKLDMRNDFLFSGMALIRDRSYGMTSCGTGGIWAITSAEGAGEYFFGRTMIEDTSSTHLRFFEGKRSIYLPPMRGKPDQQLMRAVPKVSANYLEALERWDTGAIQILMSLSLPAPGFWLVMLFMVTMCTAVLLPAFTTIAIEDMFFLWTRQEDLVNRVVMEHLEDEFIIDSCLMGTSVIIFGVVFGSAFVMSFFSPALLNRMLRYLVRAVPAMRRGVCSCQIAQHSCTRACAQRALGCWPHLRSPLLSHRVM